MARALLDEADKLAAEGRYAEAVRLILHRSIEEIEGRRPRLVRPAFTAREIGRLPDIPDNARATFVGIAERRREAASSAAATWTPMASPPAASAYEAFAFPGAWA